MNRVLSNIVGERTHTDQEVQNRTKQATRITSAHPKLSSIASEKRVQSSQGVRFGRPESANFVVRKLVGTVTDTEKEVQEEVKKFQDKTETRPGTSKSKTSYQVRPKYSGRPQHITGRRSFKEKNLMNKRV